MDKTKLQEVFSDKEYVESIAKLSPEEAAKSLCAKGVEVTAEDLVKLRDFIAAHKDELQNGELSEEALAGVMGGMSEGAELAVALGVSVVISVLLALPLLW